MVLLSLSCLRQRSGVAGRWPPPGLSIDIIAVFCWRQPPRLVSTFPGARSLRDFQ